MAVSSYDTLGDLLITRLKTITAFAGKVDYSAGVFVIELMENTKAPPFIGVELESGENDSPSTVTQFVYDEIMTWRMFLAVTNLSGVGQSQKSALGYLDDIRDKLKGHRLDSSVSHLRYLGHAKDEFIAELGASVYVCRASCRGVHQ